MTDPISPLLAFDEAVREELLHVSHVHYDSWEICKHFAGLVRKRLAAAPALPAEPPREPDFFVEIIEYCPPGSSDRVNKLQYALPGFGGDRRPGKYECFRLAAPGAAQTAEHPTLPVALPGQKPIHCPVFNADCSRYVECSALGCRRRAEAGAAQTVPSLLPSSDARDAARYRWLLDALDSESIPASLHEAMQCGPETLGSYIDAALRDPAGLSPGPSSAEPKSAYTGRGWGSSGVVQGASDHDVPRPSGVAPSSNTDAARHLKGER